MKNHGLFTLLIRVGFEFFLFFILIVLLIVFLFGIWVVDLDSLFSDLFLEFLWVFQIIVIDEFVDVFMGFLDYWGVISNLFQRFLHFLALEVLLNRCNGFFLQSAFFLEAILDVFRNLLNVPESDKSVDDFGIQKSISIKIVFSE